MTAEPVQPAETPAVTSTALAVITDEDQATADRRARLAVLAASVGDRLDEVDQEITADLERFDKSGEAFWINLDAELATARQANADYATVALAGINSRLDAAREDIAAMCTRQKVAA